MPEGGDSFDALAHELAWAASPQNKDSEIRAQAKDILDKLYFLQYFRSVNTKKENSI